MTILGAEMTNNIYLETEMTILGAEVTWIRLTPPHVCVCPKPGLFAFLFFVFNDLRWEVVVYFVDIGGKNDHQYTT